MPCCSWKNRRKPWQHWDLWLPVTQVTTPPTPYLSYDADICVFTYTLQATVPEGCLWPALGEGTVAEVSLSRSQGKHWGVLAASTFVPWESWTKLPCWRDHLLGKILQLHGEGVPGPSLPAGLPIQRRHIINHQKEQQEKLPHWTSNQITEKWTDWIVVNLFF